MRKLLYLGLSAAMVVVLIAIVAERAQATHGNLKCSDCHTIHYSQDGGVPSDAAGSGPHRFLLKQGTSSDTCLRCHDTTNFNDTVAGTYAPVVLGSTTDWPGGDFSTVGDGAHNVSDAADGSITSDTIFNSGSSATASDMPYIDGSDAPQTDTIGDATYPWRCASCHNPHDRNGARLLRPGSDATNNTGITEANTFGTITPGTAAVPTVDWIPSGSFNIAEASWGGETGTVKNGYRAGFSAWCANCHLNFDEDTQADNHHPSSNATTYSQLQNAGYDTNYGATYDVVVPIEDAQNDWNNDEGAGHANLTSSYVFCLSCHRSHGTPNGDLRRWAAGDDGDADINCNRCHAK